MSETGGFNHQSHGAICKGQKLVVIVRNNCVQPRNTLNLKMTNNQTLWNLREKIAEGQSFGPSSVRLIYKGRKLSQRIIHYPSNKLVL
eukprot:UN00010